MKETITVLILLAMSVAVVKSFKKRKKYEDEKGSETTDKTYIGIDDIHGKPIHVGDKVKGPNQAIGTVEFFDSLTWDSGGSSHPGFYCREWLEDGTDMDYHSSFREVEII